MLVLEESFLGPAMRNEPSVLAWSQWGQQCLLHDMSDNIDSFSVIGRRLIYLETAEDTMSPGSRLRTVEFNPQAVGCKAGSQPAWACSGRGTTLSSCTQPGKAFPRVRSNSMDAYNATMFGATEDNLVLFHVRTSRFRLVAVPNLYLKESGDETLVRILTFGKSTRDKNLRGSRFI